MSASELAARRLPLKAASAVGAESRLQPRSAEIVLPLPVPRPYTYEIPGALERPVERGAPGGAGRGDRPCGGAGRGRAVVARTGACVQAIAQAAGGIRSARGPGGLGAGAPPGAAIGPLSERARGTGAARARPLR